MKFIDEAVIEVSGGKGGNGCLSFRREKYIPLGGPDGGNGGEGGSVYVVGQTQLNTLIDYRYQRRFEGKPGKPGEGNDRTGAKGQDCIIPVPSGTLIFEADTGERIGEILSPQDKILVASGGSRGLGNQHFKSSTNRSPRKTTRGGLGEHRFIRLELRVLADVGLLGLPNAGKSSLIAAISSARPKIADYPFTTLHPNLGIVKIDDEQSFVVADIPGLIEGASEGMGLGTYFLKHLSRTRILLHLVDIQPIDGSNPEKNIKIVMQELKKYDPQLAEKQAYLVFNKVDLLSKKAVEKRINLIIKNVNWSGPFLNISALNKEGTQELCYTVAKALKTL